MEILERESALAQLQTAWQTAQTGNGRFLLISGEAGIGKTSLVEQFIQRQTSRVLWGACDALFTPRPLGPLHDMAAQLRGELLPLLEAPLNRPAIFAACLSVCQTPTILVFEDIHWADEATLDLLKYLGRRIQQTSSLVIATYRDDELGTQHPLRLLLGEVVRHPGVVRLGVMPLSVTAVRHLAQNYAGDVTQLHRLTAGNPFFITQVLTSGEEGIPLTVREVVLARVSRLSLSGRAVLNAAAVIGQRIEPWLLKAVTQAEADVVDESLELGILLVQGDHFVFRHELARQAILNQIAPHQRTLLHQAVLDALIVSATGKKDLARLAHHAEAAGDKEAILTYAPQAARQAEAAKAHRAAVQLFELALAHAENLPAAERAQLLDEFSVECDIVNRRPDAIAKRREAVALWQEAGQPLRQGQSLTKLALLLQVAGQKSEAEATNRAALEILEPLAPNLELISAYNMEAWLSLGNGDSERGVAMAEKGITLAQYFEEEVELPRLLEIAGLCWLYLDHAQGTSLLEQSLRLALKFDHATRAGNIYANLASIYVDFYQFERAEQTFAEGLPFTQERHLDSLRAYMDGWLALHKLFLGEWAAAETVGMEASQRSSTSPGRGPALVALGRLRARRGEPDAWTALDEGLDMLLKQGFRQREGMVRAARAEAAWLAGDHEKTFAEARLVYDLALSHHHEWYVGELAFWLWCAGEAVELPEWAAAPFALQIAGDWRGAAEAWEMMGCPYEQARALAYGDSDAQIKALTLFEQLEAQPMAEWVRQQLRAAGADVIPRGPRASTKENPFYLTNRQMEVWALLAEELTNADIAERLHISPKTVDHHVSAVLGKLVVSSREEAAELARQLLSD
ncbi:MAG: AAA family ATPase [Ardenticatenaceae bacterium]|nr:AAA family ATPase [Ardenticatenaceae bacterium]MCB8947025.1 AAA family ATPase [Ardenticatenaceae bacterium]